MPGVGGGEDLGVRGLLRGEGDDPLHEDVRQTHLVEVEVEGGLGAAAVAAAAARLGQPLD
ncbi:hypothetical protein ACIQFU_09000 [Streptomyces sp. NPDC093065]|uniref:hypothetical protein n=1 Tax=Streptomyces sp. NPDC093065 TaxID=3366021 RepID=UPI0037F8F9AB